MARAHHGVHVSESETGSGSEKIDEPVKRAGRMEASDKRRIVEALVLSCSEPISAAKLAEIIPYCDAGEVKDLVAQKISKIGENMNIRRFTRFQLGEA